MRNLIILSMLLIVAVLFSASIGWEAAIAEDEAPRKETSRSEISDSIKRTTDLVLSYLSSQVKADGSIGSSYSSVAVAALAGTAFLSQGSTPGRGKYGNEVRRITRYILSNVHETSGYISSRAGDNMYGHGFATMFLAEVYGMSPDPQLEIALRKAVKLIEYSQGVLGGWRYQPRPDQSDISVTICQVMALRAARNAGIPVDPRVIEKAKDCVKSCSNADGGFCYIAESKGGGSSFPRTAAGVCILYYLGEYGAEEVKRGLKFLDKFRPSNSISNQHWSMYGYYYAAQAMFQVGGDQWNLWYNEICNWLISNVSSDGSINSQSGDYATAMAAIIMQIPVRYLPILQR